jgi:nitrate/TMAO reductase-like tetraheme cytochrome c subunit
VIFMSPLAGLTVFVAVVAAGILIVYWVKQPRLDLTWRLLLFAAIALLPTVAAGTSTTEAMGATSTREFCGSCHVMGAHYRDALDPTSMSLAARHTRNDAFGEHSCYNCHAEYGMLGYPLTKMNGLRHVWHYYFGEYGSMTLDEALSVLHTVKPYPNENCMHCHTGLGKIWLSVPDHAAVETEVRSGKVSCASVGCHGAPHPATVEARAKLAREKQAETAASRAEGSP